jgi:hypothetical protein
VTQDLLGRAANVGVATFVPPALGALLTVVLPFINAIPDVFRDRDC